MDTLLVAITAISLGMALAMGALLAKLLREERLRSNARVASLLEMADRSEAGAPPAPRPAAPVRQAAHPATGTPRRAAPRAARDPVADLDLRPTPSGDSAARMFAEPERSSPWGARLAAAAGFVVVISALGYLALTPRSERAPAGTDAAASPDALSAPLELLALRHASGPGTLTVSGLVHNPRHATPRTGVVATAYVFGSDGALLASGRAPLDFTTLAAGDESPFVVTVPVTGTVARYRVGFRSDDGAVIAHVDKRPPGDAVARR